MNNLIADQTANGIPPVILYELDGSVATDKAGNVLTTASLPLTLYERTNLIENGLLWACETWFGCNGLQMELESELTHYFDLLRSNGFNPEQMNFVHFAHSGNFQPMIKALEGDPRIPIKTMIAYETPYVGDGVITQNYLNTIIQVHGTETLLNGDVGPPFLGFTDFKAVDENGNVRDITEYNIEILGAGHSDFSCPATGCTDFINQQTNLFMRDLGLLANDGTKLEEFLKSNSTPGINFDPTTGIITVDPDDYQSPFGMR